MLSSAPPLLQTQEASTGQVIQAKTINDTPLNGRNWEQLVTLTPGVSDGGNSDTLYVGAFAPQGTNLVTYSFNGGRREENNYLIDGADNVDRGSNLTLQVAGDINDRGEITGTAFDSSTHASPAFLAIPREDGRQN